MFKRYMRGDLIHDLTISYYSLKLYVLYAGLTVTLLVSRCQHHSSLVSYWYSNLQNSEKRYLLETHWQSTGYGADSRQVPASADPLRDPEQNWSVDLAEDLTQAVSTLAEQGTSFGQYDEKTIDFSKAALLIQGGAHVYSKKVWIVTIIQTLVVAIIPCLLWQNRSCLPFLTSASASLQKLVPRWQAII